MITVLYRRSSSEIIKISPKGALFADADTDFWGVAIDPIFPDGMDIADPNSASPQRRVFGYAKIYELSIHTVRNATQAEIATWATKEIEDEALLTANHAKDLIINDPLFRKLFMMIFRLNNKTRTDAGLTAITKNQFITFVNNNLSKDD